MRLLLHSAFVVALSSQIACENAEGKRHAQAKVQESIMVKTDVAGLQRLVNLPYPPTSVQWWTSKLPGRDDWSLDAVLKLRAEDIKALLESAERLSGAAPTIPRAVLEDNFPPTARNELATALADKKAERIRVEATRITGAKFAAPDKSPAIHGEALVFERYDIVYLSLYTM